MRFTFTILCVAFALGISAGVMVEPAIAPSVSAGPLENGLERIGNEVDVPTAGGDITKSIIDAINFLLSFVALIAVIAIIVAGFVLIFGMGSEASATRAKKIILYTILGLVVIFFSRVIVGFFTGELASIFF